jgi:hypothetical protein
MALFHVFYPLTVKLQYVPVVKAKKQERTEVCVNLKPRLRTKQRGFCCTDNSQASQNSRGGERDSTS